MREMALKPSRRLGMWLVVLSGLAGLAIVRADLPPSVQVGLGAAALTLAVRGWRRAAKLPALALGPDGSLHGRDEAGNWRALDVAADSFVSPALIVLRCRREGEAMRTLTLLPDSASPDDLRRLRTALRWARRTRSDTSSPDAG